MYRLFSQNLSFELFSHENEEEWNDNDELKLGQKHNPNLEQNERMIGYFGRNICK
jgi:hypothetical protein